MIYEVVSSESQLLRQRVHIRAQHARERRYKIRVLEAIEEELGDHLLVRAYLNRNQLDELFTLQRRLSGRLFSLMAHIQARLSARDTIAFLNAWMNVEGLRDHRKRLNFLAKGQDAELQRQNIEVYLVNRYDRLGVYISTEVRRPVRWVRYHVQKAADDVREGRVRQCKRHLARAVFSFVFCWALC